VLGATGAIAAGVTGIGVGSGDWIGRAANAERTSFGSALKPFLPPEIIGSTNIIFFSSYYLSASATQFLSFLSHTHSPRLSQSRLSLAPRRNADR
jgi:hypothetical protein